MELVFKAGQARYIGKRQEGDQLNRKADAYIVAWSGFLTLSIIALSCTPTKAASHVAKYAILTFCMACGFSSYAKSEELSHPEIRFSVTNKKLPGQRLQFSDKRFTSYKSNQNSLLIDKLNGKTLSIESLPVRLGRTSSQLSKYGLIAID